MPDMCVYLIFYDWQVSCDSLNGGRSQQHSEMSEAHRRPRAVPHIPDPQRVKGELLQKKLDILGNVYICFLAS